MNACKRCIESPVFLAFFYCVLFFSLTAGSFCQKTSVQKPPTLPPVIPSAFEEIPFEAFFSEEIPFELPSEKKTSTKATPTFAPAATSTPTVIIAIIDTGIDYLHPDLEPFLWHNPGEIPGDGIDNDGNGYIDDVYGWDFYHGDNTVCHYSQPDLDGTTITDLTEIPSRLPDPKDSDHHGTHIAGIIVSETERLRALLAESLLTAEDSENSQVLSAISSGANIQIMSLKVLGGGSTSEAADSFGSGSIRHTIQAIQYAKRMGADICCLSWGTSVPNSSLQKAIEESDMLFVAAAGNSASDNDLQPVYPASFALDNLISVASIDSMESGTEGDEGLSEFSNYGINSVDMAAPGRKITSTVVGGYATMSGTSMSAPSVCAAAALLYAASWQTGISSESVSAALIKKLLIENGRSLPALESYLKYPLTPDPLQAISALPVLKLVLEQDKAAPELTTLVSFETTHISLQLSAIDPGSSGIRTIRYLPGVQDCSAFQKGTAAITVSPDALLFLYKPGYYTFYLCDYAGNESIQILSLWPSPICFTAS